MSAVVASPPAPWRRIRFAALIGTLGFASLAWNLVATLLLPILPRAIGGRIGRAAISRVYRVFWALAERSGMMEVDAKALDALTDVPGGLVVAANHPTMLDALVVVSRLPRGVCVMKAELQRNVFLGAGARLARYIGNDCGRGMVRDAVATLREGNQLVLFPEGTRTARSTVDVFRPGVTLIAQMARVPIQTVFIESESPYLTKGWPLLRVPPGPVVVRVRLGERFSPESDHRALLRRLQSYFASEVRR